MRTHRTVLASELHPGDHLARQNWPTGSRDEVIVAEIRSTSHGVLLMFTDGSTVNVTNPELPIVLAS